MRSCTNASSLNSASTDHGQDLFDYSHSRQAVIAHSCVPNHTVELYHSMSNSYRRANVALEHPNPPVRKCQTVAFGCDKVQILASQ